MEHPGTLRLVRRTRASSASDVLESNRARVALMMNLPYLSVAQLKILSYWSDRFVGVSAPRFAQQGRASRPDQAAGSRRK